MTVFDNVVQILECLGSLAVSQNFSVIHGLGHSICAGTCCHCLPSTHLPLLRYTHTKSYRLKVGGGWFPKDLLLEIVGGKVLSPVVA